MYSRQLCILLCLVSHSWAAATEHPVLSPDYFKTIARSNIRYQFADGRGMAVFVDPSALTINILNLHNYRGASLRIESVKAVDKSGKALSGWSHLDETPSEVHKVAHYDYSSSKMMQFKFGERITAYIAVAKDPEDWIRETDLILVENQYGPQKARLKYWDFITPNELIGAVALHYGVDCGKDRCDEMEKDNVHLELTLSITNSSGHPGGCWDDTYRGTAMCRCNDVKFILLGNHTLYNGKKSAMWFPLDDFSMSKYDKGAGLLLSRSPLSTSKFGLAGNPTELKFELHFWQSRVPYGIDYGISRDDFIPEYEYKGDPLSFGAKSKAAILQMTTAVILGLIQ